MSKRGKKPKAKVKTKAKVKQKRNMSNSLVNKAVAFNVTTKKK